MKFLEVANLIKDYFKKETDVQRVLEELTFSVEKGECFVIIGPNGSGKTTLLRIIGLLEPPTSGNIRYLGKDITNLSKKVKVEYRRKIAFVRQKPVVLNTTVFKNIAYGLRVRGMEITELFPKVKQIIDMVGLKGLEMKSARSLSGGEMQRVAIASNFVLDSELYLLDEVSANLDPKNVNLLERFIDEIKKDKEKTIIMSTHDRFEAIKFADRIGVLNEGRLIQIGKPNEIFTMPKDEFTALFVGYENIFEGIAEIDKITKLNKIKINNLTIIASSHKVGNVKVCIRPESIGITKEIPKDVSYRNNFKGVIENIRDLGNICQLEILCQSEKFLSTITNESFKNLGLSINKEVFINFKATDVQVL